MTTPQARFLSTIAAAVANAAVAWSRGIRIGRMMGEQVNLFRIGDKAPRPGDHVGNHLAYGQSKPCAQDGRD